MMTLNPQERLSQIFRFSLQAAFRVQLSLDLKIRICAHPQARQSLLGVGIRFEDQELSGKMRWIFPRNFLSSLEKTMTGEERSEKSEIDFSAALEMINIAYASARKPANDLGHKFQPALPFALSQVEIQSFSYESSFECESVLGPFLMDVSVAAVNAA